MEVLQVGDFLCCEQQLWIWLCM